MAIVIATVGFRTGRGTEFRELEYLIDVDEGATVGAISAAIEEAIAETVPDNPSPEFYGIFDNPHVVQEFTVRAIFY